MSRRVFKVTILLVIFGVPVLWYLFLQLFGENKFELTPIRTIDTLCSISPAQVYLAKRPINIHEENQLNRLMSHLEKRQVLLDSSYLSCLSDTARFSLFLIDDEQYLRGYYDLTILEVDRLIVEIDLINQLNDGTNSY